MIGSLWKVTHPMPISWMNPSVDPFWIFFYYFQEVKVFYSSIKVSIQYVGWSANEMADAHLSASI